MADGLKDLRYSLRQLWRNPGFTITAVLTLMLGIGATTAVFSVAYGVLIDPFPYKDVKTLATPKLCTSQWPRCGWNIYTPKQFIEIEQKTDIFSGVSASTISNVVLTGGSEPQRLRGNYITPNTFSVMGGQPMLGRDATEADVVDGHAEVTLLSYRYWKAHWGADPSILGKVLTLNGRPRTVIGVMPPRFLLRGADVYLPIKMTSADSVQGQRSFALVGRLKPGVTEAKASAELGLIFAEFKKDYARNYPNDLRVGLMSFDEMFQSGLAKTLHLVLGAVVVLLLIACVNVSSLMLARAVQREHEFVVRAAIGASQERLIRHALMEALVLVLVALPLAWVFAYAALQAMLRIVPAETIPDEALVTMNVPVLLVSMGLGLATVILSGMAPAWHSANPRLAAALGAVRSAGSKTRSRLLSGFVVTEIALSLGLLMLAGLMVRSLIAVESGPMAFSPEHTLAMGLGLSPERYPTSESRSQFFRDVLDRVRSLPGVTNATPDDAYPFIDMWGTHVRIGGLPEDKRLVSLHLSDYAYLQMAHKKMLQGHFLDEREVNARAQDAVVTKSFVKRYFEEQSAIGQTVHLPELLQDKRSTLKDDAFTIVGVMEDLPAFAGNREDPPHIFVPYSVGNVNSLIIETALPADDLQTAVRHAIYKVDADQPVSQMMSLRQMLDMYGYAGPRFALALFGTFAGAALLLSLVGVYGVLSFVTSQRTKEIGVRMALGAGRPQVMWTVLRQALVLSLIGVAAGLPLAYFAGRLAQDQLVKTSQHDVLSLCAAICVLPMLAVAGTLLPARRAAGIDPAKALKAD